MLIQLNLRAGAGQEKLSQASGISENLPSLPSYQGSRQTFIPYIYLTQAQKRRRVERTPLAVCLCVGAKSTPAGRVKANRISLSPL